MFGRSAQAKTKTTPLSRDDRERLRKATFARKRRSAGSNIGPAPPENTALIELRERCREDLHAWHAEVFKESTGLKPFGEAQRRSIDTSADVIRFGGRVQKLEPRGFVKTSRAAQEAIWSICYGYRRYPVILGSGADKAKEILAGIQLECEENERLLGMFPKLFWPIRALAGRPQRAAAQHIDGIPTRLRWTGRRLVFPTCDEPGSGATLAVVPVRNARGLQRRTINGVLRPDIIFLDDIQTDDDAASKTRVRGLLRIVRNSILRLGALADETAVINSATVIEPDDVPDTLSRDPSWLTVRIQLLEKPAKREDLWFGPYAELLKDYTEGDKESKRDAELAALKFYEANRAAMDEGAVVGWQWAWPWKAKRPRIISAIQFAYTFQIQDPDAYASEGQNAPRRADAPLDTVKATLDQLRASVVPLARGSVPLDSTRLIQYIDVHKNALYWLTLAKSVTRKHVVAYGTWPPQPNRYFDVETAKKTIPDSFPGHNMKEAIRAALKALLAELAAMRFLNPRGERVSVDETRVDANWGQLEDDVKAVLREVGGPLVACHGVGIRARDLPMAQWKRKPGQTIDFGHIRQKTSAKAVTVVLIDTNTWKTETHLAIATPVDVAGSLSVHAGDDRLHEMFFDHVLAENPKLESGRGRELWEWHNKLRLQNHWGDCLVGAMVDPRDVLIAAPAGRPEGNRFQL